MTGTQAQSTMSPLGILLELTHRCPLQCPYCSNPLELVRASHELDTATWQRVIHEAAQMGVLQVHLSGGEPAARKDLEDIVAACSAAGLYSNLITSGLLIDAERLRRLADAGLDHVQLSLQDVEAKNVDRITNYPSAFRRKLEFAGHVLQVGLPLTLNAVIHRQNVGNLEAMIALAEKLGAGRLEVAHVQYYGWALANRDALLPTRADVTRTTEIVEAARARLKGTLVIDYVTPDYYGSRPKACMGGWGRQVMVITPQGEAWPCHAAKIIPGMSFENVSTRSLPDIWTKSDAFMRFRGTDWMPDPCKSCDRREIDWGGCRCQAQALLGDAALTDPVCELSASHAALAKIADASASAPVPAFRYRRIGG